MRQRQIKTPSKIWINNAVAGHLITPPVVSILTLINPSCGFVTTVVRAVAATLYRCALSRRQRLSPQ